MPPKRRAKSRSKSHVAMSDFPAEELQGSTVNDNVHPPDFDLPPPEVEPQIQPAEEQDVHELDEEERASVKKRRQLTALTSEQEEQMAEWLVEHSVLWNKKMKDYKDIQMKDALWREQAEKMDKDANELKVWYKSLRTRYGRLKKMPSGSGAPEFSDRDKWILQKLEFLRPYIVVVPKRTTVSLRAKMGLQQQGEMQPSLDDNTDQLQNPCPAENTQCSETSIENILSSSTSARPEVSNDAPEREILKLQQQLLDYFKKPQPTEERDCYADWLRSVFHSFDTSLFRRCQKEISGVIFKYQELNESMPPNTTTSLPASSSQSLHPSKEQPDSHQSRTSKQPCNMRWQPHPSTWPTNVQNQSVSLWGSQDVQWLQQQQLQQPWRQDLAQNACTMMTFSNSTRQGESQENNRRTGHDICTFLVEGEQ